MPPIGPWPRKTAANTDVSSAINFQDLCLFITLQDRQPSQYSPSRNHCHFRSRAAPSRVEFTRHRRVHYRSTDDVALRIAGTAPAGTASVNRSHLSRWPLGCTSI
jgi:hypothetical protein